MKVSNLPPAAENEEYLDVFFESTKRQGGGPVKKVTLMKDKHFAIVEFEEHDGKVSESLYYLLRPFKT